MALAALISAAREAEEGGLIATIPLAGRALVERQARLAARAGARHIVILVERLPAALTAAIDRLRRDGIGVEVARGVGDAADHIHPDERLLLFADGAIADDALLARLARSTVPALLVAGDDPDTRHWERIDATQRWAGLALLDGATLRNTAARLGDWDLQATLLRQAASAGARRIGIADGADTGPAPLAALISEQDDAVRFGARLAAAADADPAAGWPARFLFPPLARGVVPLLAPRRIEPLWLRLAAALLTLLMLPAITTGWWRAALALAILAAPLDAIGARLAAVRLLPDRIGAHAARIRLGALGVAAPLLGWRLLAAGGGWGCLLLGAAIVAVMAGLAPLRAIAARGGVVPKPWLADADALCWLLVPFAAAVQWRLGLGALALYALVSLYGAERAILRAKA